MTFTVEVDKSQTNMHIKYIISQMTMISAMGKKKEN
jgi:hypothetical protein